MADNVKMPLTGEGDGARTFATEDVAGVHHQRVRVEQFWTKAARVSSAKVDEVTSGDRTIVAGVAAQTIRIHGIFWRANGAVNVSVKDGASTVLVPAMAFASGDGGFLLPFSAEPWFVMADGNAFVLNLSAAVQVSGRVYYAQS